MTIPTVSRIVFKDGNDRTGVVLRVDGRLSIISSGEGLSVQMDAAQLRALAQRAAGVAALLADQECAAAEEAGADLRRITAAGSMGSA